MDCWYCVCCVNEDDDVHVSIHHHNSLFLISFPYPYPYLFLSISSSSKYLSPSQYFQSPSFFPSLFLLIQLLWPLELLCQLQDPSPIHIPRYLNPSLLLLLQWSLDYLLHLYPSRLLLHHHFHVYDRLIILFN